MSGSEREGEVQNELRRMREEKVSYGWYDMKIHMDTHITSYVNNAAKMC